MKSWLKKEEKNDGNAKKKSHIELYGLIILAAIGLVCYVVLISLPHDTVPIDMKMDCYNYSWNNTNLTKQVSYSLNSTALFIGEVNSVVVRMRAENRTDNEITQVLLEQNKGRFTVAIDIINNTTSTAQEPVLILRYNTTLFNSVNIHGLSGIECPADIRNNMTYYA